MFRKGGAGCRGAEEVQRSWCAVQERMVQMQSCRVQGADAGAEVQRCRGAELQQIWRY